MFPRRSERLRPLGRHIAASIDSSTPLKPTEVGHSKEKRSAKSNELVPSDPLSIKSAPTGTENSSTPKRRRISGPSDSSPVIPTPTLKALVNVSSDSRGLNSSTQPSLKDRPVEPHRTNAPLSTPGGSRIVSYPEVIESSRSKHGVPRPTTTTTEKLLEEACNHLIKTDPRLKPIMEKHYCSLFAPEGLGETIDPFRSLCSSIMAQQVSGAAAKSIKKKFITLFNDNLNQDTQELTLVFPAPAQVVASDIATLRTAGLSGRKAEYIKGLAEKFVNGDLSAEGLIKASDEDVMEKLTAVRGLGKWSVEMFACFALKRMDVFSTGDLGVQRGMAAYMGKGVNRLKAKGGKWKYMSEQEMLEHSAKFAPYRSLFMWYMWRVEDVDVEAVQDN